MDSYAKRSCKYVAVIVPCVFMLIVELLSLDSLTLCSKYYLYKFPPIHQIPGLRVPPSWRSVSELVGGQQGHHRDYQRWQHTPPTKRRLREMQRPHTATRGDDVHSIARERGRRHGRMEDQESDGRGEVWEGG